MTGGSLVIGSKTLVLLLILAALIPAAGARASPVPPVSPLLAAHNPIVIEGNAGFTAANGVTGGKGTAASPYVIGPWAIDGSASIGVDVRNTTAYFVVQDVNVTALSSPYDGVKMTNVVHGSSLRLNVSGVARGVVLEGGSSLSVQDSRIWQTPGEALVADSTQGLILTGNDLRANVMSLFGFHLIHVRTATVGGNLFDLGGVFLDTGNRTDLDSYTITPDNLVAGLPIRFYKQTTGLVVDGLPTGQLIVVDSTDAHVANLIVDHAEVGVHFAFVDGLNLSSSLITGSRRSGMSLLNVTNALIQNIQSRYSSGNAGEIDGGTNLTIESSSFDAGSASGLVVQGADGVHLVGVEASGGSSGVYGARLIHFEVRGGNLSWNGVGLQLADGGDGIVQGVSFYSNGPVSYGYPTGTALLLSSEGNVTVTDNNLTANGRGMIVETSVGVRIVGNRFVDNFFQAADDSGSNRWNDSYPGGGNYWSDYPGYDDCHGPLQDNCTAGDGFGDTPYRIPVSSDTPTYPALAFDFYPIVTVNPPNTPPVAVLTATATSVITGQTVIFDAGRSFDPDGSIAGYSWDLGDGTTATSRTVLHAYATAGTFTVRLVVTDNRHATNATTQVIQVTRWQQPTVALVTWVSPIGYQLPVPRDWTRHENYTSGATTADLFLEGVYNGTPANLLVDSNETVGALENSAFLGQLVNETFRSVRQQFPGVTLADVTFRSLSGHAGVLFVLHYDATLYQDVAIVVSEPHQRMWLIILTAASAEEPNLNGTFEQILQGFAITAAPPGGPTVLGLPVLWILAIGVAVAAVAGVVVFLLVRARRRKALVPPPPSTPPEPPHG